MDIADILWLLEEQEFGDILDAQVTSLALDHATPDQRHAVALAASARKQGLTLRQALNDNSLPPAVRHPLLTHARDVLVDTNHIQPPDLWEYLRTATSWDARYLLEEEGPPWLIDVEVGVLGAQGQTPREQQLIDRLVGTRSTVRRALYVFDRSDTASRAIARALRHALFRCWSSPMRWVAAYREQRQQLESVLSDTPHCRWTRQAMALIEHQAMNDEVGLRVAQTCDFDHQRLRLRVDDVVYEVNPDATPTLLGLNAGSRRRSGAGTVQRTFAADALRIAILALNDDSEEAQHFRDGVNRPSWHRALVALDRQLQPTCTPSNGRVLAFRVDMSAAVPKFEVASAVPTKAGTWRVRAENNYSTPEGVRVTPEDAAILRQWRRLHHGERYAQAESLIGHPRVIPKSNRGVHPISVRREALALRIDRTADTLRTVWTVGGVDADLQDVLDAARTAAPNAEGLLMVDGTRIRVVPCPAETRALILAMRDHFDGADPDAAGPLLQRLPQLTQRVDVNLGEAIRGRSIERDDRLVVRARFDGGLQLAIRVQPLPEAPTQFPGEGPDTLHSMREDQAVYVQRDPEHEVAMANALVAELGLGPAEQPYTWFIDDLDRALTAAHHLSSSPHRLQMDGSFPSTSTATASSMTVRVRKDRGWFTVGGKLTTNQGDVDLQALLDAVQDDVDWVSTGSGYVRLTDTLKSALSSLNATRRGGKTALSAVHAPLIDALEQDGATVHGAASWTRATAAIAESRTLQPPVPSDLNGTLRAYQADGFAWLARLAHWAPGAVLADDMGLGKTIQSIALLLRRASTGPALVIAPTSVGFNWLAELARFAPSLAIHSYRGSDRQRLLGDVGKNSVLVTSYGILVRDVEALRDVAFGTVVFDEAQALKNPTSRRARAATELQAEFRLGLSGTPVENHVDDLWSVFNCTVSGLLGSHAAFRDQWANPIDRGDNAKRKALSRVISPFLLRRTKQVVAPELPSRTEVVHRVTLSAAHRALYERTRRMAIARIADADPRQARFKVLAELTRLRQMACDPRLSDPTCPTVGTKIEHLVRRLEDVRETGDKALVFSTFVRHLTLARDALAARGFRIQWLTGSTSPDARQAAVAAFQNGDVDVFLLSTKAGGTGLNLTAASYVFHLDPWWNPASEDQATDRAHRIGQDKPVTVYRLIAADTVEERILDMQQDKRELVDALMSNTDRSEPLSLEDLNSLLMGEYDGGEDDEPSAPEARPPASNTAPPKDASPPDDWLDTALSALAQADLKASSRTIYEGALRRFARETASVDGPLHQRVAAYLANPSTPKSAGKTLRAAWKRARLPPV